MSATWVRDLTELLFLEVGRRYPEATYVIYAGDDLEKCGHFRAHVLDRFKIDISKNMLVRFISLRSRTMLEAHHYQVFTMVGQSVGSIIVGLEALWKFSPDYFVDTTGIWASC